jgi:glutamine amidotransferase
MARLFGVLCNRAELTPALLTSEAATLRVQSRSPLGWGLGFVQGGEVLMRRRPVDDRGVLQPGELAADLRTDFLLGHVRRATVGTLRPENTHPFRYRQWLFAQTGTVSNFEAARPRLLDAVPEFLRAGVRGETDAEVVFHIFLSFLHDAGTPDSASPSQVSSALRATLSLVNSSVAELGGADSPLNMMVGNGEFLVALGSGARMAYRVFSGRHEVDALIGDDLALRRRVPEPSGFFAVVLASDFASDDSTSAPPSSNGPPSSVTQEYVPAAPWVAVPAASTVVVERGASPRIEAI